MRSSVSILDGTSGTLVPAEVCDGIEARHLEDFEQRWQPWRARALKSKASDEESAHWEWRDKMSAFGGLLAYPTFALECGGETQGLMILNLLTRCRLPSQRGKDQVYVEFLETAPWNRPSLASTPRYKGVGPALVYVAITVSLSEGYQGRLGLHSLPQADAWYRDRCGMTDLGIDPTKGLRYFEMSPRQARLFLNQR